MKFNNVFFGTLLLVLGCQSNDNLPLSPDSIQISGNEWGYSSTFALVRLAGSPPWRDTYVKLDGDDGSFFYVVVPATFLDSLPSFPYHVKGRVFYYASSSINGQVFEGDGDIEMVNVNPIEHQISLSFEANLSSNGQSLIVQSGEISEIDYKEVFGAATNLKFNLQIDQNTWLPSEYGADMSGGQIDWFFMNNLNFPSSDWFRFEIPWGIPAGTYPIGSIVRFEQEFPHNKWVAASGTVELLENSFPDARQKAIFSGVFYNPDTPTIKIVLQEGLFVVSF